MQASHIEEQIRAIHASEAARYKRAATRRVVKRKPMISGPDIPIPMMWRVGVSIFATKTMSVKHRVQKKPMASCRARVS